MRAPAARPCLTQIKARPACAPYEGGMLWLTIILHIFIGATLAGVGIVVVLVTGQAGAWALGGAVLGGFLLAFPLAWVVARAMMGDGT